MTPARGETRTLEEAIWQLRGLQLAEQPFVTEPRPLRAIAEQQPYRHPTDSHIPGSLRGATQGSLHRPEEGQQGNEVRTKDWGGGGEKKTPTKPQTFTQLFVKKQKQEKKKASKQASNLLALLCLQVSWAS